MIAPDSCDNMLLKSLGRLMIVLAASLSSCEAIPHVYPNISDVDNERTPLYFGLQQSLGGDFDVGLGTLAGVRVALDLINRDASLLPGYRLHYTFMDSQVDKVKRPANKNL